MLIEWDDTTVEGDSAITVGRTECKLVRRFLKNCNPNTRCMGKLVAFRKGLQEIAKNKNGLSVQIH